jgi:hypothetical protein
MNINASIVDQRVTGIIENNPEYLPADSDINKKKSSAFVLLCISTCLDIPLKEAAELLTEGGKMPVLTVFISERLKTVNFRLRYFRANIRSVT